MLSFARVPEVPDVVKTPLAALSAGTFGIAEPWWPASQDGKTPLPEAAPRAGLTAHGAADNVMEGTDFQTQLLVCVYRCTCHCSDRFRPK